jgi:hypothetical protein
MEEWAEFNEEFFGTFLALPHGIPSHDTCNRVFAMFAPAALQAVLVPGLWERRGLPGEWMHVDGKTLRGTRCRSQKVKAGYVLESL